MNLKQHNLSVIIPAAGAGKRMERDIPKIMIKIGERTILEHTIRAFYHSDIYEMIIPVSGSVRKDVEIIIRDLQAPFPIRLVEGGKERQDSVWNALKIISNDCDIVAVHDAARPFFDPAIIHKSHDLLEKHSGVIAAVPATYTMKSVIDETVEKTLDRSALWQVNTPQIFQTDKLVRAYKKAYKDGFYGTDDAMLIEHDGGTVVVVRDIPHNIKITTPSDLIIAKHFIQRDKGVIMHRIGQGYDVHRLMKGPKLILGGVEIPYDKGLDGHSDADVLVHAVMDAILGALALGDIGKHFPDNDEQYKNADSIMLLGKVCELMADRGYVISNIDATLVLQKPKVAPYINKMRNNIADALQLHISAVSVKATTEEGLGFTGREEGVAAMATVLMTGI